MPIATIAAASARLAAATGAPSYGLRAQRRRARTARRRCDTGIDEDFVPDVALADGALVAGDGWQVEAIATPGHASDHLVFALAGSDLIFSGDHVMAWSTTVVAPPEGSMADYMASLDRLLARPEDTYLPGHGGPVDQAHAYVRALKAPSPRARSGDPRRAGRRARERFRRSSPRSIADLDPRLAGAAGLSVLAHLEDLIARGTVARDGPPGPAARFRLSRR